MSKFTEDSKFNEMAAELSKYYTGDKKAGRSLINSLQNVINYFTETPAKDIEAELLNYRIKRQTEGMSNDTINLEFRLLKRVFTYNKLKAPDVPFLKYKVRDGTFSYAEYLRVKDALPEYCKALIGLAYISGMRQNEMLTLQWNQADLTTGKITLKAQDTKSGKKRFIYLKGEYLDMMIQHKKWVMNKNNFCPYVFTYNGKTQLKSIKRQWKIALEETGLQGKIFHDFRRSALTNLIRAGISETTAMRISGHSSSNIFKRYQIINEEDVELAGETMAKFHADNIKAQITKAA